MTDKNNELPSVNDKDWIFYKDREEWADVEPVPQNDGEYPVVSISYTDRFVDVYDYFRAILKSQEKSERALELTRNALELNPANYTVWQYRRDLLKYLKKDLLEELHYTRSMIEANEKNYQVWHHRRVIVQWLQDPSHELRFTEIILASDAKNYHAWQYRQWVIKTFNLYNNELEFVERLLEDDVRNNSAWNQRYFVIKGTTNFTPNVLQKEVDFTIGKINLVVSNESAWNYLRMLMSHCIVQSDIHEKVCNFCKDLYHNKSTNPFLLAYLVDLCDEMIQLNLDNSFFNIKLALQLCELLENKYDKIRCHYWSYIARTLSSKYDKVVECMTPS
ncbi:hypothetical protein RUM44_001355 [Polyplax serrata]|uniref:Protein farnesyltransferase/geranylgeranyltransferase type-1 subunit alpha n=1 Tax=Polyplax serrata TaxID=468196 RepID=A0ABR1AJT7_POLSC